MNYTANEGFWVTDDGSYGAGKVVMFDKALTDEEYDILSSLPDSSRYDYVLAVLKGEDTSYWEF